MSNASVYEDLRAAIATGEIAPEAALIEGELAKRFDAGRPAVRVALARLEQEGLVEQRPHQSARVRMIDAEEAIEIAEMRSLIEQRAAQKAAQRATKADIARLTDLISEMRVARTSGDFSGLAALDRLFHQEILRIAADTTVSRLHAGLHGHLVRFHIRTRMEQEHASSPVAEHEEILRAIAAADPDEAARTMALHLDKLASLLRDSLTKA